MSRLCRPISISPAAFFTRTRGWARSRPTTTARFTRINPVTNQESGLLSLGYEAFGDWRFELDGTIARVETVTDLTYTDLPTGELELLINDYRDRFDTWETAFRGDGSLFSLPAGMVRLAAGAAYRNDRVNSTRHRVLPPVGFEVRGARRAQRLLAYAELFVPFVSKEQNISGARRIEMSIAARYDNYSDFGSTTNPKVGLVWSPIDVLDLRASYGTSFRAPSVAEKSLYTRGVQISTDTFDAPGGGTVPIFYLLGSTPLSAEKSRDLRGRIYSASATRRRAELQLVQHRLPGAHLSTSL